MLIPAVTATMPSVSSTSTAVNPRCDMRKGGRNGKTSVTDVPDDFVDRDYDSKCDACDDAADDNEQKWLQDHRKSLCRLRGFLVVHVCDLHEHLGQCPRSFAGHDELLHRNREEMAALGQGGKALAE